MKPWPYPEWAKKNRPREWSQILDLEKRINKAGGDA
jgi:hypothetical protein